MAAANHRNDMALKEVWKREENAFCVDCGKPDPDWASYTLGVFICLDCSRIHSNIPSVSKVKSLRMDHWDEAQVQFLAQHGNTVARATYEAHVPIYYYHPVHTDCQLLREQWIQAKYQRKEFMEPGKPLPFSNGLDEGYDGCVVQLLIQKREFQVWKLFLDISSQGWENLHLVEFPLQGEIANFGQSISPPCQLNKIGLKEGILWKRGRDNGQYFPRRFLLSEREGCLKYFTKQDAKEPKMIIKIDSVNATFQPEKTGHPNGLQITYLKDNKTRNIFLYHEDGKEIVDWFNAIRAVLFHYLKVAFPVASDKELKSRLTRNFLKEGYMEKTGPRQKEPFKKRWFTLDHRRLMYFKDPLDAFAKGEVFVGSGENGYSVKQGLPAGVQGSFTWPYVITIVTPDRDYLFTCETEQDRQEWVAAFSHVIEQPMTPQEYAIEAYFKLKP